MPTVTRRCGSTPPPRCTTGDLNAQADALVALLDADYIEHQVNDRGQDLDRLGDAWESVARKLCGT